MARRTEALRPDEIVRVAAGMFTERGYANTRMQDIADTFGATHAALYYHFKNKEEVLQRINEIAIDGLLNEARRVEVSELPRAEHFEAALRAHIVYVTSNIDMVSALFDEERELSEEFSQWLRRRRREYTKILEDMFRDGQTSGRYASNVDSRYVTNLILGACSWIYRWYRPSRYGSIQSFADATVEMLARGFREGAISG